jgi:hypothetical protein
VKVGFSGTRMGLSEQQKVTLLTEFHALGASELHHGDCVGADEQAHQVGRQLGLRIIGHPPTANGLRAFCECDEMRRPAPFLTRNHNIVHSTQILVACPNGPERRQSGTWATIRFSRRLHLPHIIILPTGEVTRLGVSVA